VTVTVNGERSEVPDGTTVADVVARLGAGNAGSAVAVNSDVVARRRWPSRTLADGDRVEVLAAVQGG
jgi:sulfur carrier protein